MIESVLLVFWVVLVVSPLVTLAHELAHALVAATVSARPVLVRVGAEPALVRSTLGRLRFRLNPWRGWVGLASWEEQGVSVWRAIGVSAAGPLASLLLAVALALAAMALSGFAAEMAGTAGLYAFIGFVLTGFPWRYPSWWSVYGGQESDGLRAWHLLRDA